MSNQGMDPAHSYFLRQIRIQTLSLCNGWRSDMKYLQDIVYCFGRLCAAIPNVVIRHSLLDCPGKPTVCVKPESWCKIQKRTSLPKKRNLFGWLLRNLRRGETCEWAYTKTWAHMEMSANIKSPASESSFNQEGFRAASEAPIMREVLGLTQEVWSFRMVCLITSINRDNVRSARRTRPCCRLLIFNRGKKMRLTFLQFNSLQCQSDLKAEQNLNLCLNCLCGSSWVSLFSSVYTNALCNIFCFPFCLFAKRRTTGLDTH